MAELEKFIPYSSRITAFVDILGMREHVRRDTADGAFIRKFVKVIRTIISGSNELPADNPEGLQFPTIPLSGWGPAENRDLVATSMSDSIVISLPATHGFQPLTCGIIWPIHIVIEYVFWLQRALLQLGVLSRGAITFGNLHHSQDIVAGDALIEAYELETALAIYPRVILSDSIVKALLERDIPEAFAMADRIASLFAQDADGLYFVDYLGLDILQIELDWPARLSRIEQLVDRQLTEAASPRVRQKLGWLKSYVEVSAQLAADMQVPRPHGRDGPLQRRYPRFSMVNGASAPKPRRRPKKGAAPAKKPV